MRLVVSEELMKEDVHNKQMEELEEKIRLKERELYEEEQELSLLENKYKNLKDSFFVDIILCIVVVLIFVGFAVNAASIVYRLISWSYFMIVILTGVVGFIASVIRKVKKDIPLFVSCKNEEKGRSSNKENYVYKINKAQQNINSIKREIEQLKYQKKTM